MTTTMYSGLHQQQQQHISEGGEGVEGEDVGGDGCDAESHSNKVDHVCVAVRKALNKLGANKYLLSIITTHVKMTNPELEIVLEMIKQLKGKRHVCIITCVSIMYIHCTSCVGCQKFCKDTKFKYPHALYTQLYTNYNFMYVVHCSSKSLSTPVYFFL